MSRRRKAGKWLRNISVEQILTAVAWGFLMLGALLLGACWIPARVGARPIEKRLATLSGLPVGDDLALLRSAVAEARARQSDLKAATEYWLARRNSFGKPQDTGEREQQPEDGRIDFKIALFNARTNLMAHAANRDVKMPPDIGINETLSTDTRVESALGQLSATMRLLDKVMESGVREVSRVQPLPLRMRSLQSAAHERLREYPVRIEMPGDFGHCLELLALLGDPDTGYALENLALYKEMLPGLETRLNLQFVATAGRPLPRSANGGMSPAERAAQKPPAAEIRGAAPAARATRRPPSEDATGLRPSSNAFMLEKSP